MSANSIPVSKFCKVEYVSLTLFLLHVVFSNAHRFDSSPKAICDESIMDIVFTRSVSRIRIIIKKKNKANGSKGTL